MHRKISTLLVIIAIFLPMIAFGQTSNPNAAKLLEFLKGQGAFETWFMQVFTKLDVMIESRAVAASMIGRTIGGLGALCYLGYLGFQMQEGARPWEVTPMIRPIIIGTFLLNWVSFSNMISVPLQRLADSPMATFSRIEDEANNIRVKKFEKQNQLLDGIIKMYAEEMAKKQAIEAAQAKEDGFLAELGQQISSQYDKMNATVNEWFLRADYQLQKWTADVLESIALAILRVCTYLIFFIQKIWQYVLLVLGPIAVGLSLIPGFESNFGNWVSKYININLYSFIAYTIINIGQQLIMAGYEIEIDRYNMLVDSSGNIIDPALTVMFLSHNGMLHAVLFSTVPYIITGIGVLMTPSIADAIVTGMGGQIVGKAKSMASSGYGATQKGATTIVKGATAASSTLTKTISIGSKK